MILLKFPNSAGMNPISPFLLRLLEKNVQISTQVLCRPPISTHDARNKLKS
jgi:hypothetical protein